MKTNRLVRIIGAVAVVLLAVAALGQVARSGSQSLGPDRGGSDLLIEPGLATDDGTTSSLERLLGSGGIAGQAAGSKGMPPANVDRAEAARNGASVPGAPGPAPASGALTAEDRKIVQTASVRLQVEEVGGSFEEVGRIATGAGGFVASSSFSYQAEAQIASMTIRVPASQYQGVLSDLRRLGVKVDAEDSKASDVSEQYSDLSARLRNLEATEGQLLALLARAQTIQEILTVQDRLNGVRSEIEQVKGRLQLIENLTEMATITVHLRPVVAKVDNGGSGVNLGAEIREAWNNSIEFLGGVAAGVIMVVVFSWWIPLVAIPGWIVLSRLARNRQQPASAVD
jgi:hypothetical protein